MDKPKNAALTSRAIPSLTFDKFFWEGTIVLSSWSGYQSRRGAYGARDSRKKSDGTTQLAVSPPDGKDAFPLAEQFAAYCYLVEHQQNIRDRILAAVLEEYPRFRSRFYEVASPSEPFPNVDSVDGLRRVLGLTSVLIHPVSWEGVAYVGYEFGCAWDAEHGLELPMMHRDRIVDLAGS